MSVFGRLEKGNTKPVGALNIRNDQVARFYEIVLETWENPSDVWALKYGPMILGAAAAFSGFHGNMYFRRKMRLRDYGFFSTYLPNMALPFVIVSTFHKMFVHRDIYIDPIGCTICKGTKAALAQATLGIFQPLILVPASTFMFATRHFTYRIPSPLTNRKDFFKFCVKLYGPLKIPMSINLGLQVLLALFVTHIEEKQFLKLQTLMVEKDENIENMAVENI